MLAAGRRTIRVVNQDVVVASGANDAVDCFAELFMPGSRRMFAARLFAAQGHEMLSFWLTPSTSANL
jgi:hypothetical protein